MENLSVISEAILKNTVCQTVTICLAIIASVFVLCRVIGNSLYILGGTIEQTNEALVKEIVALNKRLEVLENKAEVKEESKTNAPAVKQKHAIL